MKKPSQVTQGGYETAMFGLGRLGALTTEPHVTDRILPPIPIDET